MIKKNSCKFCDGKIFDDRYYISGNKIVWLKQGYWDGESKIKFCPICGNKLKAVKVI